MSALQTLDRVLGQKIDIAKEYAAVDHKNVGNTEIFGALDLARILFVLGRISDVDYHAFAVKVNKVSERFMRGEY